MHKKVRNDRNIAKSSPRIINKLAISASKFKMRSSGKYSKATICRHMKKSIGDLAVDKRK